MSEELSFHYIAIALRYRYGSEATMVAIRKADRFRQQGDCKRTELWMKVIEALVGPALDECAVPHLGG